MTTKKDGQIPKKVENKGSVTPIKENQLFLRDDIYSTENCQSLHFLLNNFPSSQKDDVFKFKQNDEDPIYVTCEDVYEFLRMSWINIPILEIFLK